MSPSRLSFVQKLFTLGDRAASALRVFIARLGGARIASDCRIGRNCELGFLGRASRQGSVRLDSRCELGAGCILHPYGGSIHLSENVFVGPHVVIYGHGGVEIGRDTLISMHCCIVSSNHTVPATGTNIRSQPDIPLPVKIGRDVWLGAGVRVLGGVSIGDGCVVGAGAVVTKDLPPGSIAFGIPAGVVRERPRS